MRKKFTSTNSSGHSSTPSQRNLCSLSLTKSEKDATAVSTGAETDGTATADAATIAATLFTSICARMRISGAETNTGRFNNPSQTTD